ncbi:MAG: glutamate--tRNA ligase [Myxococcales bacterium]|nr:glutamate--tRNA ligase [Myxococcales bacterium]
MTVRVRFAPSPTGYLHVGGLRTAIFNFLFARHHGGVFILRIEDTDTERSTQAAVDQILDSLRWMNIAWDEGPYFQSQRMPLYRAHLDRLLESGHAYRCYCPAEELEKKRKAAESEKRQYKYDGTCRHLDPKADPAGRPFVIRFRMPEKYPDHFDDLVLGRIPIDEERLDDWILARSDGMPVYNFCVVVDDADMRISHVIRGNDHVANTPRQILLYQAFGYSAPQFAHIPLIHGPDGSKLSKRREAEYRKLGMSVSVQEYARMGYLPHALFNYMTRVGWSAGDQELFSLAEFIQKFDLDGVGKASGIMNPEKLKWVNAQYLKAEDDHALAQKLVPLLAEKGIGTTADDRLAKIAECLKPRSNTLVELAEKATIFFIAPTAYDEKAVRKFWNREARAWLEHLVEVLPELPLADEAAMEERFKGFAEKFSAGNMGKIAQPLRLALTGSTASPSIFTVMNILGKDECRARIRRAIEELGKLG